LSLLQPNNHLENVYIFRKNIAGIFVPLALPSLAFASAYEAIPNIFIKPKGSLPHSQQLQSFPSFSQLNPVHVLSPYLFIVHHITLPSIPRPSK
jgi:hypothetical protein